MVSVTCTVAAAKPARPGPSSSQAQRLAHSVASASTPSAQQGGQNSCSSPGCLQPGTQVRTCVDSARMRCMHMSLSTKDSCSGHCELASAPVSGAVLLAWMPVASMSHNIVTCCQSSSQQQSNASLQSQPFMRSHHPPQHQSELLGCLSLPQHSALGRIVQPGS